MLMPKKSKFRKQMRGRMQGNAQSGNEITFGSIDPIEIYGPKNEKINLIKSYFPDLKITARGTEINLKGDVLLINQFKTSFLKIINYFHKYAALTNNDIERLIHNGVEEEENFFDS